MKTYTDDYLDGTKLGNYLISAHYGDMALGTFIDYVNNSEYYENTVFVLYGDHDARLDKSEYQYYYNYDVKTGEVLKEKRPCTAWGFTTLDNQHIVCQVTARKWEIIKAETLEVKESFTHKEFTGNHTDFCINHISLCENGNIRVAGFQNVWDDSEKPPKMLPNIEFEYFLTSKYFEDLKDHF